MKDRHYHNFNHIESMWHFILSHLDRSNSIRKLLYATLYHDVIYDSKLKDKDYLLYTQQIRQEYSWVKEDEYRQGRLNILNARQKPSIRSKIIFEIPFGTRLTIDNLRSKRGKSFEWVYVRNVKGFVAKKLPF